ncbi:MAG: YtxH domain-containing protein [Elusimicrobiota bacterium]
MTFLLGGIIGGALGLLLAPRKGEETREIIQAWLEESRDKTVKFIDDENGVLSEQKQKIEAAWEAGKKAYNKKPGSKSKH